MPGPEQTESSSDCLSCQVSFGFRFSLFTIIVSEPLRVPTVNCTLVLFLFEPFQTSLHIGDNFFQMSVLCGQFFDRFVEFFHPDQGHPGYVAGRKIH